MSEVSNGVVAGDWENVWENALILFNTNFSLGNLQLTVGKVQLPAPSTFLNHDAAI